jgi:hypothetical protein
MTRVCLLPLFCLAASAVVTACGCAKSDAVQIVGDSTVAEEIRQKLVAGGDESEGGAASTAEPTGWATLRGTFKVSGTPRKNPVLSITSDKAVCQPGGAPVEAKQVVIGAGGELANTLIFIRKIPDGWLHKDAKKAPEKPLVYDQKNCTFLSHVTAVNANQKIILKNSDPIGHNTNIPGFANPLLQAGGESPFTFGGKTKSVPLDVTCSIHPWMKAYMIPLDNNYFSVTGKDGKFEIKNLPAGVPLEFQVWQEVTGGLDGVEHTNPNVKWGKKGRFVVTLEPDKEEVLDVTVPAAVFN